MSIIFVGYLISGVFFLAKLAGMYYATKKKNADNKTNDLKKSCSVDILKLILKAHKKTENEQIQNDSSSSNGSDPCTTYIPAINTPSKIFSSDERVLCI